MNELDRSVMLALNFDGGPLMDRLMLTVSGTTMWLNQAVHEGAA